MKKTAPVSSKGKYFAYFSLFVLIAGAYGGLGYMYDYTLKLENQIAMERKVYVYSLEEVLKALDAVAERTKFENEVLKLNDELFAAEKKIKSIKDAKVKDDFSDVYLRNLKLKRDDLITSYENKMKKLSDDINEALVTVAKDKKASTIFVNSAIVVKTEHVEDVTPEIIKQLKSK